MEQKVLGRKMRAPDIRNNCCCGTVDRRIITATSFNQAAITLVSVSMGLHKAAASSFDKPVGSAIFALLMVFWIFNFCLCIKWMYAFENQVSICHGYISSAFNSSIRSRLIYKNSVWSDVHTQSLSTPIFLLLLFFLLLLLFVICLFYYRCICSTSVRYDYLLHT